MWRWGKENKRKERSVPDEGKRQTDERWSPSPRWKHRERNGFRKKVGDLAVNMLIGDIRVRCLLNGWVFKKWSFRESD